MGANYGGDKRIDSLLKKLAPSIFFLNVYKQIIIFKFVKKKNFNQ